MKAYTARIKAAVLALMGGKCVKCGFSDPRALQIDHVNRRKPGEKRKHGGTKIYQKILNGSRKTEDLQLLCANCNWIKKFENNEVSKID